MEEISVKFLLLAANDVFLTMVFQACKVLTIVPFGNADAVTSYKYNFIL